MKKYQVEKVENGKSAYIADIIEAESEIEAINKYIGKIISYWRYCAYAEKDFMAKEI